MAKLPEPENTTVNAIYKSYEKDQGGNRAHLGASQIGLNCRRMLWYSFRWATHPQFDGRLLRLFQRGQLEEEVLIRDLRRIGVQVWDRDDDGRQFAVSYHGGHFSGSADGVALGIIEAPKTPHLLEFKTANKKSFDALSSKGVQVCKPEHYAQMQIYMHGLELTRALYLAVCKDDDRIYQERVHYDPEVAEALIKRAEEIITAPEPFGRISEDPAYFECKFCGQHPVCHQGKLPEVNCRTCAHSTPLLDGTWKCGFHDVSLTVDMQREGCEHHLYLPDLVPFEQIDASQESNFIEYRIPVTGKLIRNGDGFYSSKELRAADPRVLGDGVVEELRLEMNAEITG